MSRRDLGAMNQVASDHEVCTVFICLVCAFEGIDEPKKVLQVSLEVRCDDETTPVGQFDER